MTAAVLLTAMAAGQYLAPGPCSATSAEDVLYLEPIYPSGSAHSVVGEPVALQRYRIDHEGLSFEVEGYIKPGSKLITWEPSREFNRRSYAAAVARAAAKVEPEAVPASRPEVGQVAAIQNFGLAPERMGRKPEEYRTPSDEARKFVTEAKAPASATARLHVTVIGSDDDRAPVVNDLNTHPALASFREALMVQDYKPGEWPVDPSLKFPTTGRPAIVIQQAKGPGDLKGGRVVWRASDYAMGPQGLAEAIRRVDPDYQPAIDPGPATAPAVRCPFGFSREHWPYVAAVALSLFALARLPRKEG